MPSVEQKKLRAQVLVRACEASMMPGNGLFW